MVLMLNGVAALVLGGGGVMTTNEDSVRQLLSDNCLQSLRVPARIGWAARHHRNGTKANCQV